MKDELRQLTKADRLQYRTDMKALMCRGIEDSEVNNIKQGLQIENGVFVLSRMFVPTAFYRLFRRGVFTESFTVGEAKHVFKIILMMHAIDCAGHLAFKWWTTAPYTKHIYMDADQMKKLNKKTMEDYITQKSYFKTKKDGKNNING